MPSPARIRQADPPTAKLRPSDLRAIIADALAKGCAVELPDGTKIVPPGQTTGNPFDLVDFSK